MARRHRSKREMPAGKTTGTSARNPLSIAGDLSIAGSLPRLLVRVDFSSSRNRRDCAFWFRTLGIFTLETPEVIGDRTSYVVTGSIPSLLRLRSFAWVVAWEYVLDVSPPRGGMGATGNDAKSAAIRKRMQVAQERAKISAKDAITVLGVIPYDDSKEREPRKPLQRGSAASAHKALERQRRNPPITTAPAKPYVSKGGFVAEPKQSPRYPASVEREWGNTDIWDILTRGVYADNVSVGQPLPIPER